MKWTKEEIEILRKHYADCDCEEMSKLLPNRRPASIRNRAYYLGIKKSKALVDEACMRNIMKAISAVKNNEEYRRKSVENRIKVLRNERMRIAYGLPQKTRIKLCENSGKVRRRVYNARYRLKKRGYRIEEQSLDAYYDESTHRSPCEDIYRNIGFRFIRLGDSAEQEQVRADNNEQPFTDFYL